MACTIDHLRPNHGVRVLRDFTDARGKSHGAGATGIIRQLGFDGSQSELWIDWDRDGVTERLYFALGSTTGPGNGRMREYFELGAYDPGSTAPEPPVKPKSELTPTKPKTEPPRNSGGRSYSGQHPPAETNLGEVSVACDCDPALHRAVLIEFLGVNACLRCGTVTCSRSIGDEGRYTGNSWHAYLAVAVSPSVLHWLSQWPRVTVRRHGLHRWPTSDVLGQRDVIYLPAGTRCQTPAELVAREDEFLGRTSEIQFPSAPPPAELPGQWQAFAHFWSALQLTPESEFSKLLSFAQLESPGSAIAVERLLRRPDAFDILVAALRSREVALHSAGTALARAARPVDPRLPEVLIEILNGLSFEPLPDVPGRIVSWGRLEELFIVIADLKLATPNMLTALKTLQRRLVRHDPNLASYITIVLRELLGELPPTHRGPWLP